MVRKYKRKITQGSYGSDRLSLAVAAVREGQSIRGAGADYGIPRRTLIRHCSGNVRRPGVVAMGSKRCVFSSAFEAELVQYAKEMSKKMYGLTTIDVRRLAYAVAAKLGVHHQFDDGRGLAGKDWLSNFMRRHPELSIRVPISTSLARIEGFNREAVKAFFALYKDVLKEGDHRATAIWNCDETGFTTVTKAAKVLCQTGTRQVRKASSGERGKNITALCCVSAAGSYIPPLFVVPRKRMVMSLMNGAPAGSIGAVNERGSGYIDGALFMKWLKHFVEITGCTKEHPHLLLLDGPESHKTLEAIDFGREHGVIMLTFPPHCTHRLQPLNRTFFKSLKSAFSRSCDNWLTSNRGRAITQYEVIAMFERAYSCTATIQTAVNGFATSGLWSYNDSKFDAEFEILELSSHPPQVAAVGEFVTGVTDTQNTTSLSTDPTMTTSHDDTEHAVFTEAASAPDVDTSPVPSEDGIRAAHRRHHPQRRKGKLEPLA